MRNHRVERTYNVSLKSKSTIKPLHSRGDPIDALEFFPISLISKKNLLRGSEKKKVPWKIYEFGKIRSKYILSFVLTFDVKNFFDVYDSSHREVLRAQRVNYELRKRITFCKSVYGYA